MCPRMARSLAAPRPVAETPSSHTSTTDRAHVLGCAIDRADLADMVARIDEVIAGRGFACHTSINAAKVVAMREDPEFESTIRDCELVSPDGQSVVWASRLLGDPLPSRVAGIDLMQELMTLAERRGYAIYILGATDDVLQRATERIRARHPGLKIAGTRNGYFAEENAAAVAAEIASCRPDIVFVAMPSPRKEYWLRRYGRRLGAPFVMGVGGSVDVLAGEVRRAPVAMQRLGLEWLFRLAQEPRRLLRRYLSTNARFIAYVIHALGRRLSHRSEDVRRRTSFG
jgi:N-acetylglucosaminyldiphosphoundecaprenol N-acetyl-beta-D-mannosaminyltransferase